MDVPVVPTLRLSQPHIGSFVCHWSMTPTFFLLTPSVKTKIEGQNGILLNHKLFSRSQQFFNARRAHVCISFTYSLLSSLRVSIASRRAWRPAAALMGALNSSQLLKFDKRSHAQSWTRASFGKFFMAAMIRASPFNVLMTCSAFSLTLHVFANVKHPPDLHVADVSLVLHLPSSCLLLSQTS